MPRTIMMGYVLRDLKSSTDNWQCWMSLYWIVKIGYKRVLSFSVFFLLCIAVMNNINSSNTQPNSSLNGSCTSFYIDKQREKITRRKKNMPKNELKIPNRNHCQNRTPFFVFFFNITNFEQLKNGRKKRACVNPADFWALKFVAHLFEVNDLYERDFSCIELRRMFKMKSTLFFTVETVQLLCMNM